MESINIAIVIPAYNESKTIANIILELRDEIQDEKIDILVVNDFSSDNTGESAEKAGAIVLNLKSNHGYSKAIEKGLNYIASQNKYTHIVTMDADGQHHPKSVKAVIELIKKGNVHLIIGTRDNYARLGEWLYGKVFSCLFKIKDPLCGLKAYSVEEYKKIGFFESFDSIGTELMTRMIMKNVSFNTIPIFIRDREDEARFGSGYRVNIRILKSLICSLNLIYKKNN